MSDDDLSFRDLDRIADSFPRLPADRWLSPCCGRRASDKFHLFGVTWRVCACCGVRSGTTDDAAFAWEPTDEETAAALFQLLAGYDDIGDLITVTPQRTFTMNDESASTPTMFPGLLNARLRAHQREQEIEARAQAQRDPVPAPIDPAVEACWVASRATWSGAAHDRRRWLEGVFNKYRDDIFTVDGVPMSGAECARRTALGAPYAPLWRAQMVGGVVRRHRS